MQLRSLFVGLAFFGVVQAPLFAQTSMKHLDGQELVFVVNGAGDNAPASDNLTDVAVALHLPLRFQVIGWCRGDSALHDYKDYAAHWNAARRLAGSTTQLRKECPNAEIYLVGQSTGARIVLAAAEMSPPKSVERIILIASAVGSTYDLRPALRASRAGIDHFWNPEDDLLERVAEKCGLPDGSKGYAAGQVAFRVPPWTDAEGFGAYRNIRQYRWRDGMPGHGGHLAWIAKHNVKNCILPLFFQPTEVRLLEMKK